MKLARVALVAVCMTGLAACKTEPKTESGKSSLTAEASASKDGFVADAPWLKDELEKAAGYAVLPDVGKAAFIAGGAYGKGEVFEKGKRVGHCDLSQGTVGLQIGAQTYDELIIFKSADALKKFKDDTWTFSANASAVAIKPGAAAAADYREGVAVFVRAKGGLMAEVSLGGQKLRFTPLE